MRKAAAITAFDCQYIDVVHALSPRGPRVLLDAKLANDSVKVPAIAMDVDCTRGLIAALIEALSILEAEVRPN
jgi:hypothetical protein